MSTDGKNSVLLAAQVSFWVFFAWWMLGVAGRVEIRSWIIPIDGLLGLINLAWFAYRIWQRRASNSDGSND